MNAHKNYVVFISYSWDPNHFDKKVEDIVARLLKNGVDVIFDKYDCKPGNDVYKFMEDSVNNPSVDLVLIMCTEAYKKKADDREKGVGAETLIISPQVYKNCMQSKIIPIILEKDERGNPYKPTYIESNIHIDLSDEAEFEAEFEKLLRFIYNKPLLVKPELGSPPAFLENEDKGIIFSSPLKYKVFHKAIVNGKPNYLQLLHEFGEEFINDMAQFEIPRSEVENLAPDIIDELILKKIEDTITLSQTLEELAIDFGYYWNMISEEEVIQFIESFTSYIVSIEIKYRNELSTQDHRSDLVRFIMYLFILQLSTALIQRRMYASLKSLIEHKYQAWLTTHYSQTQEHIVIPFINFCFFPVLLENLAKKCQSRPRVVLQKMIFSRQQKIKLVDIQETDFVLGLVSYLRAEIHKIRGEYWRSLTLTSFAEVKLLHLMSSIARFNEAKVLFGIDDPAVLSSQYNSFVHNYYSGFPSNGSYPYYEFGTLP